MSSVDVIVPCYRYGHYLAQCVDSVLAQRGPTVRVLVINDASPDSTQEVATSIASRDSRVTVVQHLSNKGHIYTYNEGLAWASARYLLLLSADDYLLPGALEAASELMNKRPEIGLTFGNALEVDDSCGSSATTKSVPCQGQNRILEGREFVLESGARNIVPTPTALVRTELQKAIGGYLPALPHSGDLEMWLRIAAHASIGFVNTPMAVYRRHSANMSLSYANNCWLPDLKQKKEAFDHFFAAYGERFSNRDKLRDKIFRALSYESICRASAAFNLGEQEISDSLLAFSILVNPRAPRSLPWAKLLCKRTIGLKAWRSMQPTANHLRRLGRSLAS